MNISRQFTSSHDGHPVVVGVDPSISAREATVWAADLAAAWGAPLDLVHVVPELPMLTEVPPWLGEPQDAARRTGAVASRADILWDVPADRLAERADGARMLVLGSYGDAADSGMLAGSLAHALLDRVTCPVAVIRGSAPPVPPPGSGPVVVGVDGSPPDAPRSSSPPAWPTPGLRRWSPCTPGPMSSPGSTAQSAAPKPRRRSRRRPTPGWRPRSRP